MAGAAERTTRMSLAILVCRGLVCWVLSSVAASAAVVTPQKADDVVDFMGVSVRMNSTSVLETSVLPGLERSAELSQLPLLPEDLDGPPALFPEGRLDADLQQVDLREVNSWRLKLHEVPVVNVMMHRHQFHRRHAQLQ